MGNYLNDKNLGAKGKADSLVSLFGAGLIVGPPDFANVPPDSVLVCVMENAMFDAAMVITSERDFNRAQNATDLRPKKWLYLSKDKARKMADIPEAIDEL